MTPPLEPADEFRARVRFLGLASLTVCLVGWGANFYPFDDRLDRSGTPLGADFACFYVAGRMVLDGRTDELYRPEVAERELKTLFPTLGDGESLPFRYPPFVAGLTAPLAALPYAAAWALFAAASLAAGWIAWRALVGQLSWLRERDWRATALVALCGWPVVWEVVLGGQWSLSTAAIVCLTTRLLYDDRKAAAGAVLALALFKPNVLTFFAIGLVLRHPRMLVGAVPTAVALVAASAAVVGRDGLAAYATLGMRLASGNWDVTPDALKFHGLLPWLELFAPGFARPLLPVVGLAATVAVVGVRRRAARDYDCAAYATLLAVNALCNTYVPIYDLALLAPAAMFAIEAFYTTRGGAWFARRATALQIAAAAVYFGPHLSQALYSRLGLNVFPLLLAAGGVALLGASSSPSAVVRSRHCESP